MMKTRLYMLAVLLSAASLMAQTTKLTQQQPQKQTMTSDAINDLMQKAAADAAAHHDAYKPVLSPVYQTVLNGMVEVPTLHAQGIQIIPWTVNDADSIRKLLALHVDGIISDNPILLNQVVAEARTAAAGDATELAYLDHLDKQGHRGGRALTLGILPLHAQTSGVDRTAPVTLDSMRDRYRPLLVFAPHLTAEFRKQMSILADGSKDLRERDVLNVPIVYKWSEMGDGIVDGIGDITSTLSLTEQVATRRRFHIHPNDFTVILLGKDGGEKLRSTAPITLEKLRDTIDAMPMRQDEMRSKTSPQK